MCRHLTSAAQSNQRAVALLFWEASYAFAFLASAGVATAARLSGGAKPLSEKRLPPSLDVFGWCTWDAFYSSVSARGIAEGLSSLHKGGIFPRTLIIDDGWQVRG